MCIALSVVYLRARMDEAMGKQVFVKSRQQLVEVTGRISLSLAITGKLLVTVFLQFPKCPLLYEYTTTKMHVDRKEHYSKLKVTKYQIVKKLKEQS